jgi:hypothetical protein
MKAKTPKPNKDSEKLQNPFCATLNEKYPGKRKRK